MEGENDMNKYRLENEMINAEIDRLVKQYKK